MTNLQTEISKCLNKGIPTDELVCLVAKSTITAEDEDFHALLLLIGEDFLEALAMAALPGWGWNGIEKLIEFSFDSNLNLGTRTRALESAICISRGDVPTSRNVSYLKQSWDSYRKYSIQENLTERCLFSLRDRLLRTFDDDYEKSSFLHLLGTKALTSLAYWAEHRNLIDYLLSLILDNQLILSSTIINKFEVLIDNKPKREEEIQKLFTQHPVLLDPFVNELFSKQQLGSDFITDFVVKRTNNEYILVEIENSTDALFNSNGSFSSNLMEAISQVRDFQAWVSDNLPYAQKKLPGIKHPEGLVVIGRSSNLSEIEKKRLVEENHSRRSHIKIVTYDELLETAKSVHKNIVQKPLVRASKETKCI